VVHYWVDPEAPVSPPNFKHEDNMSLQTVTGYKLRSALKSLELKLGAVNRVFVDSLVAFPGEKKLTPKEAMELVKTTEVKISKLQAAQSLYNTKVEVEVLGNKMLLSEAVKRVGGAGRIVALWKKASGQTSEPGHRRYETPIYERMQVRENDKQYSERTVTDLEATDMAVEAEKFASALRGAIAEGNGKSVELDLDPTLLAE
jgi:hypothetical protein